MDEMEKLKMQFHRAMVNIYKRAKDEANYPANIFIRMVSDKGGLAAAKGLINAPNVSEGYTALWERGRLDLTVEAEVCENDRWHMLFDPKEVERAWARLKKYEYPAAIARSSN